MKINHMNFQTAVFNNEDQADAGGDDDDVDAAGDINLPAGGILPTKVLRNQLQSCIQVIFSSHLCLNITFSLKNIIEEIIKIYHRVVGSEVHPNVWPSFL